MTYWLTAGDQVIQTALAKRIAQIKLEQKFTADRMSAVPAPARKHLSGLGAATTPAAAG